MLILTFLKHFFRGFQGHFSEAEFVWEKQCRSNKKKAFRWLRRLLGEDLASLGTNLQIVGLHQNSAHVAD